MNNYLLTIGAAVLVLGGCASKKETPVETELKVVKGPERPVIGGPVYEIPRAVVYKTNGDYFNNVTLQADSKGNIISFPAPSDVKDMEPVSLADGWLLTRRGVNASTVFTRYTYADYASLPVAPTLSELKAAIIPDAKITELKTLPMSQSEALANPSALLPLLSE